MVNPNATMRELRKVGIGRQQIPTGMLRAINEENKSGSVDACFLSGGTASLGNPTPNVAQMPLYQLQATQLHAPNYSLSPNSHRGYGTLREFDFLREKEDTEEWEGDRES